jgi:UDP-N-acetylglucosamine:LPS N-acetylglucosamine transferase
MKYSRKKILAVASYGGHWTQLRRLRPLLDEYDTSYVSTFQSDLPNYKQVNDANMQNKIQLFFQLLQLIFIIIKNRPDVIITTGASVGFFSLMIGKFLRAKTIWLDSIANGEEMSLSGKKAKPFADVWLSQWEDVAKFENATYQGKVI